MSSLQLIPEHHLLPEIELPALFHQADTTSMRMQRRFFRLLAAELVLLTLGSLAAVFSSSIGHSGRLTLTIAPLSFLVATDLAAAAILLAALIIRLFRFVSRADTRWYASRAVAESAKSLAWRYAVGGQPFSLSLEADAAEKLLSQRLGETLTDLPRQARSLNLAVKHQRNQPTEVMRHSRQQDLAVRIVAYRSGRIRDQIAWYERKAGFNHRLARRVHWILALFEAIGVGVVLLQILLSAIFGISITLEGFVAAAVTAGIAWSQAQRYQDLSVSYSVASADAQYLEDNIPAEPNEAAWAAFVDQAEMVFSREHRLWRSTRTM
jgi:SMODS and SLOG-associating 2TM effector domain 3/SMODS and SLOG-associating 2TM effector domain 1